MPAFQNIIGQRFGRLYVVGHAGKKRGRHYWNCLCDDGNAVIVSAAKLISGHTSSCGCLRKETAALQGRKNFVHYGVGTATYNIWSNMMQRCYNKRCKNYRWYGEKGVLVCKEWHNFSNFLSDMGWRPEGKTLDRYPDKYGPYSKENCRWATMKEQQRNRTNNVLITHDGKMMCLRDWSNHTGIKYPTLYHRIVIAGWDIEKALVK